MPSSHLASFGGLALARQTAFSKAVFLSWRAGCLARLWRRVNEGGVTTYSAGTQQQTVRVACPAACGELVQGSWQGVRCLVSCPIERYSVATITLEATPEWQAPPDCPKTVAALRVALAECGRPQVGGQLRLASPVPRGHGYGSSTADIGAAVYALGYALGAPFSERQMARIATQVEPSNSTLFPGMVAFDHREGSFLRLLGPAPPLVVVVLDPGGEVDTVGFNRLDHRPMLARLAPQHDEAFALLCAGLEQACWEQVGQAASSSARAHQALLFNPRLEPTFELARAVGALGVCRAHSGTLLGLLFDPLHADIGAVVDWLRPRLAEDIAAYRLVDGGPRVQEHGGGTELHREKERPFAL